MAITKPFVRSAYNYDRNKASLDSALECKDPSRAKQSFKDEVDINTIVKRFGLTGTLPHNIRVPMYGDFTGIGTYHEAMEAILQANATFANLPADMRARFQNDPEQFVNFCINPDNVDQLKKMGLLKEQSTVGEPGAPPATPPQGGPAPAPTEAPGT